MLWKTTDGEMVDFVAKGLDALNAGDAETAFSLFFEAAKAGEAEAQYWVARCYENKWGVDEDEFMTGEHVVHFYELAAKQGHAAAQYSMGRCCREGTGMKVDHVEAASWFLRAAEKGDKYGQYWLGKCYDNGEGVEEDPAKAFYWYSKAAEQGFVHAREALDKLNARWKGGSSDTASGLIEEGHAAFRRGGYEKGIALFRKAAEAGDANGQYWLGFCYQGEYGVEEDMNEAVYWYCKAADQGHENAQKALDDLDIDEKWEAQYHLGERYQYGDGVEEDLDEAVYWYRKAAGEGHADAQAKLDDLGIEYEDDDIWDEEEEAEGGSSGLVEEGYAAYAAGDYEKAVELFGKAARDGDADAQNYLGYCYEQGDGVEQDYAKAVLWYGKAAEQGDAGAQASLGNCYLDGRGVEKDLEKGFSWLGKAAEQGYASGQNDFGYCYEHGWGVAKDDAKALSWYNKAAEQGNAAAFKHLGDFYRDGRGGLSRDFTKAEGFYKEAIVGGNESAQAELDKLNATRKGEAKSNEKGAMNQGEASRLHAEGGAAFIAGDYKKSAELQGKAAELGDASAKAELEKLDGTRKGGAYTAAESKSAAKGGASDAASGLAAEGKAAFDNRDYKKAVELYRKAAEQGNADAQNWLGICYYTGKGVGKNPEKAFHWYGKAAEQGHADAQNWLGYCYYTGKGVGKDLEKAFHWYSKAAEQGHERAKAELLKL